MNYYNQRKYEKEAEEANRKAWRNSFIFAIVILLIILKITNFF